MNWEDKKGEFTKDEIKILSILTMNSSSSSKNLWVDYKSLHKMSNIEGDSFKHALYSLINSKLIKLGNQGQGLTVALEERFEDFRKNKIIGVINDLELELCKAMDVGDDELVKEIEELIKNKKDEIG